jgi:hypothetical protein
MPTVLLPEAAPDAYLTWVAYCRSLESRLTSIPAAALMVTERGFSTDETGTKFLSMMIPDVERQAERARTEGRASVAPRLDASAEVISAAVEAKRRWREALNPEGPEAAVVRAFELGSPPPEVASIRDGIYVALREALPHDAE